MSDPKDNADLVDVFVIGGGINGCGIARDAAGRGLSVVLAEMNDLASATSSASTKLFHGGLRYLEYFEVGLVRKALIEREVLLRAMPHISRPMRFVLPYHKDMRFEGDTPTSNLMTLFMPWMKGRRPAWLIRLGLFLYDTLGGRKILPATTTLDLTRDPVGVPLQKHLKKAFEYSDCWVDDARLVVLNARDAEMRGASIRTRTKVVQATRVDGLWQITTKDADGKSAVTRARMLVNAGGPWVGDIIRGVIATKSTDKLRLVRGSHIVVPKLFDHDKCYFFQGRDGRIIFAIPYETDFTVIGTTDADHPDPETAAVCTLEEIDYLCAFASEYFTKPVTPDQVIWTYSGVRPLFNDGASSATAATRDYVLKLDETGGVPLLNVFGGKITTYRKLAEQALAKMTGTFADLPKDWTAGVALPGGDFPVDGFLQLKTALQADFGFLDGFSVARLVRAYGTQAPEVLNGAANLAGLGQHFGAGLYETEVRWLMTKEYARTAQDVVWRRSKLGLRMDKAEVDGLTAWMQAEIAGGSQT